MLLSEAQVVKRGTTEACGLTKRFLRYYTAHIVIMKLISSINVPHFSHWWDLALPIPLFDVSEYSAQHSLTSIEIENSTFASKTCNPDNMSFLSQTVMWNHSHTMWMESWTKTEFRPKKNLFNHITHLENWIRVTRSLLCVSQCLLN